MEALYQSVYAQVLSLTWARMRDQGANAEETGSYARSEAEAAAALAVSTYSHEAEGKAIAAWREKWAGVGP